MVYKFVDATELRLILMWRKRGMSFGEIAGLLGRCKGKVSRQVQKSRQKNRTKVGRPASLTDEDVTHIMKVNKALVRKANLRYTVTIKMLRKAAKVKAGERTILNALRARKIKFRPFREKPELWPKDIRDRWVFGKRYSHKRPGAWLKNPHVIIDNKKYPVYLNGQARDYAARCRARGAFRGIDGGLGRGFVKPRSYLPSFNGSGGGKSVNICAAVGAGKVIMWHEITRRWSGKQAALMYSGPLLAALRKAYPARSSWVIMEDNDPSGYKSGAGLKAKRDSRMRAMMVPKRSPDLNVLDYRLWADITRRMRGQEARCLKSKKETRAEYKARLRRTALRTSTAFVKSAVKDMARRCKLLVKAKGWHIEE